MILDYFLYFAQFPAKSGLQAIATNGTSDMAEYSDMLGRLNNLPDTSRVPEIENYVYGQSLDELKQRIDKLFGSFLFVDYGELTMPDDKGSYEVRQRMAVTVAVKMTNHADMLERVIASDRCLQLLTKVHAWMIADQKNGKIDWLYNYDNPEIVPFVATELSSIGWTLMISTSGPDSLETHELSKSFAKQS